MNEKKGHKRDEEEKEKLKQKQQRHPLLQLISDKEKWFLAKLG